MKPNVTARTLLTDLGIGNFNATMVIPFMFMAPATTDPRAPANLLLMRHIQRALYSMGAHHVADSGFLDRATAGELEKLVGPGWLNMSWAQVVSQVLEAKKARINLAGPVPRPRDMTPQAVGMFDFLPDVPGGMLTYAVGGLVAYHFWSKRKGSS